MDNDSNKIYCSRCGSEMAASSRYCMKCGNLNENHPDNNKYSKILKETNNNNYQIGSGKRIFNNTKNKSGMNFITDKNKNRMPFVIFNIIVILLVLIIAFIKLFSINSISIQGLLDTGVFVSLFFGGLFIILLISMQIVFIKINEKWWYALIPFYNLYKLSCVLFDKGWLFILSFIPGVNTIYLLVVYYFLGKSFGKNGILSVIFGPIMMIVIAFDSSAFNNVYYVVSDSPNALEETYALYGRFAKISLFIFVIGLIGTIFTGDRLFRFNQSKDELSIIGGAKVAIKKVEKSIKKGKVSCENEQGNDVDITTNGIYYFYSEDFIYEYSFKSNLINGSRGYVKVVNDNGKYTYYIAFSADTMGLEETEKSQLKTDKVKYNVNISEPKGNMCTID